MAGAKIPLTFRIYKGEMFLREETLSQPVIKVGKLSSSHLRLDDETVSRMHAVIEVSGPAEASGPPEISIIDLGSTKGTVVNGQKVNKARLQDGDVIVLGDIRLELAIAPQAEASPAPPAPALGGVASAAPPAAPVAPPPSAAPVAPPPSAAPVAPPPTPAAAAPPPAPAVAAPPPTPAAAAPATPPPPGMGGGSFAPPPGFPGAPATGAAATPMGFDSLDDIGGARAVEVAAMLGDSVVGVRHVMNPKGGKITATTYGMFIAAAVLLLMSLSAFVIGIHNAARNAENKRQFIADVENGKLSGETIHDWRPHRISLGFDWMAFGGAATGLIALTLGMLRVRDERIEPYCRIGRGSNVHFPLDGVAGESFPLVAPLGDDFVFNFTQGMEGELLLDGQSTPLAELAGQGRARPSSTAPGALEAPIPNKARFRVRLGKSAFLVSSVAQPRRQAVPLFATLDTSMLAFLGGSAAVIIAFLALVFSIPPDPKTLALDLNPNEARLSSVESKALEDPKQLQQKSKGDNANSGGTGTKMALDEGKMGKKDSTRQSGQYAMKKNSQNQQLAKKQAMDAARNAGFLGAINKQQGGAFASLTGTGDFSSGVDDRDVYGGLVGNEVGEMQGGFGFGVSGVGPGAGGTGWGTIGTGRYGLIGHGSGTGSGYGVGSGRGGMHGRQAHPPQVHIGVAAATGDLDKNIIRRYIRRQLPRITECYERELLVRRSLRGTVVTQFQISPMGSVLSATASGIGDRHVESCVAAAIKAIHFPKPKGGGLVNVRYPFMFRPAG